MMDNILLSIVIPTRNRQKYCREVIKHILSLNLENTELVIQDNSEEDTLAHEINLINDDRICYNHTSGVFSFVDNFSKAIELARGKFICMIGDDDTILPNIIQVTKYANEHGMDAVVPELITYFWPCENPIKEEFRKGYLTINNPHTPKYTKINVRRSLEKLVANYFQDYQILKVPRIYHGIVKKEILENIKKLTGTYFSGLTPDMYMSTCLAGIVNNAYEYNNPITISGICPKSGSTDSATGKHTGELKDAPHFNGHKSYNWIKVIPKIYTVETIWAESGMQALKDIGLIDQYNKFNVRKFLVRLLMQYPQFQEQLLEFGQSYGLSKWIYFIEKKKYIMIRNMRRIARKIQKITFRNFSISYPNIANIQNACNIAYEKINNINNINRNVNI